MPCRSDYMEPTRSEHEQTNAVNSRFKEIADQLTAANDVLREYLLGNAEVNTVLKYVNLDHVFHTITGLVKKGRTLYVKPDAGLLSHVNDLASDYRYLNGLVVGGHSLTAVQKIDLEQEQTRHREADLSRLMKVFADKGDRIRLRKVLDADATKPLRPQLGFDADDF